MNDALRMQISAYIDGELPDNEAELLLRRLSQDALLRRQVSRYLEIGRLMRREREVPGMSQLRGRIVTALGDELPQPDEEKKVVGSGLMTPTTGVAVAATVAALALVGFSQLGTPVDPDLAQAVAIDDGPHAYTEPAIDEALAEQPSELMRQYFLSHGDPRMVTWELRGALLVEIEPDPHLVPAETTEQADDGTATNTP